MDKDYILAEIQCAIDALTDMHSDLANSDWKFDAEKIANDIGCATHEGRCGLSRIWMIRCWDALCMISSAHPPIK